MKALKNKLGEDLDNSKISMLRRKCLLDEIGIRYYSCVLILISSMLLLL